VITNLELPMVAPANCDGCGACCMHMGYPPFVGMFNYAARNGDPEWLSLTAELAAETRQGAVDRRGEQELPCVWLDLSTRKCKHYELRPRICRDFEIGEPSCHKFRKERGIA
jgi:Fe-S-cluster containining protein